MEQVAAGLSHHLALSCITVTFCVNLTMVQDKQRNGTRKDFDVSPVSKAKFI